MTAEGARTSAGGEIVFTSALAAPQPEVWRWIVSVEGIARELAPLAKMTMPPGVRDLTDLAIRPGVPLFRSWILLLGVLPIDRSDLTLVRLDPGEGFVEESPMLSMRCWRHERRLAPHPGGTLLTDRLGFEARLPRGLVGAVVRRLFTHRHRVLRRHFGVAAEKPPSGAAPPR